jgi:hypothetical protein
MKRTFTMLAVSLFVVTAAFAGDPPAIAPNADREAIVKELQRSEDLFLKSVEGLTEAQWNFKAAEDRWSIAQCAEHLAAAEPMIRDMIAAAIKKPLTPEMLATSRKDDTLLKALTDRSKKFKAPEPLIPTNRFGTPAEAIAAFKKERAVTIALASGDFDLRKQGDTHFLAGPLDAYGWFLFTSGHVERHTLQIEEVKTATGYPK